MRIFVRIFAPLQATHPLIADADVCPLCKRGFAAGERVTLAPARTPQVGVETVPGIPLHATCAFRGMATPVGTIDRLKDGDGSPYPVVTEDGLQHTLAEAGFED